VKTSSENLPQALFAKEGDICPFNYRLINKFQRKDSVEASDYPKDALNGII